MTAVSLSGEYVEVQSDSNVAQMSAKENQLKVEKMLKLKSSQLIKVELSPPDGENTVSIISAKEKTLLRPYEATGVSYESHGNIYDDVQEDMYSFSPNDGNATLFRGPPSPSLSNKVGSKKPDLKEEQNVYAHKLEIEEPEAEDYQCIFDEYTENGTYDVAENRNDVYSL